MLLICYGVASISFFGFWFYGEKQQQQISSTAINNKVWPFELHDQCIVDFDPGKRACLISPFAACNIYCNV
jgi:hypothetical protein